VAQVLFLGRLEDVAGVSEMHMPLARMTSLDVVMDRLPPVLVTALGDSRIRLAVNGELVGAMRKAGALMISDADEVAFLPPVSGG
jgi:molybdopterin converting factor small subunit